MPKNIEMSVLGSDGTYDVLYPKNISDIVLSSEYLKGVFNLSDNSDIDDAFDYINRKIILLQYNKAGINVTLKSAGGSPLEGIPINGITANYDGTGSCVTDSEGKCFGYCNAGSVTVSTNNYVDMTVSSQQLSVLASEMYNVELTATLINFKKWTSTTNNIRFSNNVQNVDVCCVGGGGQGGRGYSNYGYGNYGGAGGGGGYVTIQEKTEINSNNNYSAVIGSGGTGREGYDGHSGGQTTFLNVVATGGKGGQGGYNGGNYASGGAGNGTGGHGGGRSTSGTTNGGNGGNGTQYMYISFTEQSLCGGGGGGGGGSSASLPTGTTGGSPGGGRCIKNDNAHGINGLGGGGGGEAVCYNMDREVVDYSTQGNGGSGCVAIRIHLKVTA